MKKIFVIAVCMAMIASCTCYWFDKEKLDANVKKHLDEWRANNENDTRHCIIDFDKIVPFEWDTIVYIEYHYRYEHLSSNEGIEYVRKHEPQAIKKYNLKELHFLNKGKVVKMIKQDLVSDDEKGTLFCTNKDFIKRGREDAKFHLIENKGYKLFLIKEIEEGDWVLREFGKLY